jgi:hypothetical protein
MSLDRQIGDVGYDQVLEGQLGTVVEIATDTTGEPYQSGHPYFVELEACPCGLSTPDEPCLEWFAAIEIERLPA